MIYITSHLFVFHHFRKSNDFEKQNNKFFIKGNASYLPDEYDDEIAFGILIEKGLVVIVGRSHVERISIPIYAVIGGTHLIEADKIRIKK